MEFQKFPKNTQKTQYHTRFNDKLVSVSTPESRLRSYVPTCLLLDIKISELINVGGGAQKQPKKPAFLTADKFQNTVKYFLF